MYFVEPVGIWILHFFFNLTLISIPCWFCCDASILIFISPKLFNEDYRSFVLEDFFSWKRIVVECEMECWVISCRHGYTMTRAELLDKTDDVRLLFKFTQSINIVLSLFSYLWHLFLCSIINSEYSFFPGDVNERICCRIINKGVVLLSLENQVFNLDFKRTSRG